MQGGRGRRGRGGGKKTRERTRERCERKHTCVHVPDSSNVRRRILHSFIQQQWEDLSDDLRTYMACTTNNVIGQANTTSRIHMQALYHQQHTCAWALAGSHSDFVESLTSNISRFPDRLLQTDRGAHLDELLTVYILVVQMLHTVTSDLDVISGSQAQLPERGEMASYLTH